MKENINAALINRLEKPTEEMDVVIDTDAFNEIDDQYALAYAIKSEDRLKIKAIYAAPFSNRKAAIPKEGMEKSYDEIVQLLNLCNKKELIGDVYKGSEAYLSNEHTPEYSPAAQDLAKRAARYSPKKPLYIIALGAITNIASAMLIQPEIIERIVVVWLGGNALTWPHNREFNLYQDIAAARIVFNSQAALVQLPCDGVVSEFRTTGPELVHHLEGKNKLCDYLVNITRKEAEKTSELATWSRVIWDVTAVAWLLDGDYMNDTLIHSPIPEYDHRYAVDERRHFIKYVYQIKRDQLFQDLFRKLASNN